MKLIYFIIPSLLLFTHAGCADEACACSPGYYCPHCVQQSDGSLFCESGCSLAPQ